MAVRFDAAADRIARTSGVLGFNAAYTWMGWVYLVSDLNAYGCIATGNINNTGQDYEYVGVSSDGVSLVLLVDDNGAFTEVDTGYNFTTGTWAHLTIVRSSTTSLTAWINAAQQGSANTRSVASRVSMTRMEMGAFGTGNGDRADLRVQHVKIWDTNLSAAEILQEYLVARPVRTANLWHWAPLWGSGDIADYSGNGRDWTASGTLTTEDGPPVSYGAPAIWPPFTASAGTTHDGAAALAGAGTIAGVGQLVAQATSALAGAGTITAAGQTVAQGAATLAGAGTIAAAGEVVRTGAAALAAAATLAADGQAVAQATSTLPGAATLAAVGGLTASGVAALNATGTLAADGQMIAQTQAPLAGAGALAADGQVIAQGAAALPGVATLAADGSVVGTVEAAVALDGAASLTPTAQLVAQAQTVLSGAATIAGVGEVLRIGAVALSGAATVAAQAEVIRTGAVSLTGAAGLAAAARLTLSGAAALAGVGSLVAAGSTEEYRTRTVALTLRARPSYTLAARPAHTVRRRPSLTIEEE